MKGRKPKPLARAFAEGDTRKVGARKLGERIAALPKAARGLPDPPAHLSAIAAEQWAIWKQDLELMGQDFRADAAVLEGACVNYARAIEQDYILRNGCQVEEPLIDRATGQMLGVRLKNHPAVAVSSTCWRNVQMFCSDLGLTLISRQRLSIDAPASSAPSRLSEILNQPRPPKPPPSTVQ
jgi:P27 family predicted phage terminase small subunit